VQYNRCAEKITKTVAKIDELKEKAMLTIMSVEWLESELNTSQLKIEKLGAKYSLTEQEKTTLERLFIAHVNLLNRISFETSNIRSVIKEIDEYGKDF